MERSNWWQDGYTDFQLTNSLRAGSVVSFNDTHLEGDIEQVTALHWGLSAQHLQCLELTALWGDGGQDLSPGQATPVKNIPASHASPWTSVLRLHTDVLTI